MRCLPALLCLALSALSALIAPVAAQTQIHRCVGANGSAVFTDQPCAALQATPVLAAPAAVERVATGIPPPILCAANRAELRQSVMDAFANRDANRMAGLMLWSGYGRGAAIADIRSLGDLMKQPLLDVDAPDQPSATDHQEVPGEAGSSADPLTADTAPAPPPPADQLVLHTAGNDGTGAARERRYNVVRRSGCLWLRNAD